MKKYLILFTFYLFLGCLSAYAQDIYVDSLSKLVATYRQNSVSDTFYANTLNELAHRYIFINVDSALKLSKEGLELCEKLEYQKGKVESLKNIGVTHHVKGDYAIAINDYQKALGLAEQINYDAGVSKLYNNIAMIYNSQGKYVASLENHLKALKIREKIKSIKDIAGSLSNIADVYEKQGKYEQALQNHAKALIFRKQVGDKIPITSSLTNIALLYERQGKYDEALLKHQEALKIRKNISSKPAIASSFTNIADIYKKQGKYQEAIENHLAALAIRREINSPQNIAISLNNIANTYYLRKQYDSALRYAKEAFILFDKEGDKFNKVWCLQTLANIYFDTKEPRQAIKSLEEGLEIAKAISNKEQIKDCSEALSRYYEATEQGGKALFYFKQFKSYSDSLRSKEIENQTYNLITQYEYKNREDSLKLQEERNTLRYEQNLQRQEYLIYGITIFLLFIISVIYLNYQYKQKRLLAQKEMEKILFSKEQELKLKYEKNRISKDLHDNIGSQLTLLSKNLDRLKQQPEERKIENLSEMTQNIMQDLRSMIWVINKEEITGGELEEKITNLLWKTVGQLEGIFYEIKVDFQQEINLTASQSLNLFRITQEALQNAIKYSRAQNIEIRLSTDTGGQLFLKIIDDGIGFDLSQAQHKKGHYGLKNMESRAEEIGGILKVGTEVGKGTKIEVCLSKELALVMKK